MIKKHRYTAIVLTILICIFTLAVAVRVRDSRESGGSVMGNFSQVVSPLSPEEGSINESVSSVPPVTETPAPVLPTQAPPTPVPPDYSVGFVDVPGDITEGGIANFNWVVDGPPRSINTTGVYYGTTSHPGQMSKSSAPADVGYAGVLKDFLNGNYSIPLRFVGGVQMTTPGTYFFRGYALIDGNHYWSGEKSFTVKPIPKNDIKIIDKPTEIYKGAEANFTWEVTGPAGTTNYTSIVASKTSRPGTIDTSVPLFQTSYTALISDFTGGGTYNIPLRFVGTKRMEETGTFYFRAVAFIDNKNIWSDEYSFLVK